MGVKERLGLDALSADSLLSVEHVHRYRMAAGLCRGLRVVDLACGSGYGAAILREQATSVLGVDNDAATVDMARTTVGTEDGIDFVAEDAATFLRGSLDAYDAIVCFEGLEHLPDPADAIHELARHARAGVKIVVSVPNSRTFEEDNEFHVTDFGYDEAMETFRELGDITLYYQFNAEGSLIRGEEDGELAGDFVLPEHGEPEYANHFIACVNLSEEAAKQGDSAQVRLEVAPTYNRHMLNLKRSNEELWRENARIARARLGKSDAAAAAQLVRIQRHLRERAERAEARAVELEGLVVHYQHLARLMEAPRHQAVERARDRVMRSKPLYGSVRRLWTAIYRR